MVDTVVQFTTSRVRCTGYAITTDPGEEDDSSDIILSFINSDEEDANDRPNATRSEDEP